MQEIKLKDDRRISPVMKDIYRRLRTNIEFTGMENRVICVTSCAAHDGKSSIAYNLAISFTENDKKVLVIDADMRNSIFYDYLGYEKDKNGLSHYLSGKENNILNIIYATNVKHFFLLPTGVFPKNPTELLNKPRFKELINGTRDSFDYVIVDTPPLGLVVDAAVIAKECDGSLFVVPSDTISRKVVKNVQNQLKQANANMLGIVLNKVDTSGSTYGKKYGYGYGYGYAYGEYGTSRKNKEKK
jgi:capsular exopolysaccharide synthesis family protein